MKFYNFWSLWFVFLWSKFIICKIVLLCVVFFWRGCVYNTLLDCKLKMRYKGDFCGWGQGVISGCCYGVDEGVLIWILGP